MLRFIFRHIVRARVRSLLGLAIAMLFTLALGFLQHNIAGLFAEIERLYAETIVNAEVRLEGGLRGSRRIAGDVVPYAVVQDILDIGVVREMYLEGAALAVISDGVREARGWDIIVGVADLRHLTEDSAGFIGRDDSFNMQVQYAEGLGAEDFVFGEDAPLPLILSQETAESRGLSAGDAAYVAYYRPVRFRSGQWNVRPAVVLGIHDGAALAAVVQEGAVVPLAALNDMMGDMRGYLTLRFTMNPEYNRQLPEISERIRMYAEWARYPWRDSLTADIWDQELRFGVASLEQHAALLTLLFPVALMIAATIAAGLTMLTVMQSAKNAAIMRVLGMPKMKVQLALWLWQMFICAVGCALGLLLCAVLGLRADILSAAAPYFGGAALGALIGTALVAKRAPLDMLQVKE